MNDAQTWILSFVARDCSETEQLAFVIGDVLRSRTPRQRSASHAIVVALVGELGAGKTAFARGLASGFGVEQSQVSSPTFTLRMDHSAERASPAAPELFAHLDCWRMQTGALESVGFDALLQEAGALVAIEWPQKIAAALQDARRIDVTLLHTESVGEGASPQSRRVHVDCSALAKIDPSLAMRVLDALTLLAQAPRVSSLQCARCGVAAMATTFAPFCTARCRLLDLGDWLRGAYVIKGAPGSGDPLSEDAASGEIA